MFEGTATCELEVIPADAEFAVAAASRLAATRPEISVTMVDGVVCLCSQIADVAGLRTAWKAALFTETEFSRQAERREQLLAALFQ